MFTKMITESNRRIIIGGGTSFIGRNLVKHLLEKGIPHFKNSIPGRFPQIIVIGRCEKKIKDLFGDRVEAFTWDNYEKNGRDLTQNSLAVINFASANILGQLWTESYKQELIESRLKTLGIIASHCESLIGSGINPPPFLFSSAVNIYGLQSEEEVGLPERLTEYSPIPPAESDNGFLVSMNRQIEEEGFKLQTNQRIVALRLGPVLDKNEGPLPKLATPFRYKLGGIQGSGQQPFPWISLEDTIRAILFIINEEKLKGPVNLVAPNCVSQKEFAKALAEALKVPNRLWTPGFFLKALTGGIAEELFLHGQHVYPQKLTEMGFTFENPELGATLQGFYSEIEKAEGLSAGI